MKPVCRLTGRTLLDQSHQSKMTPLLFRNAEFLKTLRDSLKTHLEEFCDWLILMIVFYRNNETTCALLLLKAIFNALFKCIQSSDEKLSVGSWYGGRIAV